MKRAAYIFFLFLLPSLLPAQQEKYLDSLWGVWKDEAQHDTTRLKAIHRFAWDGYLYNQPDSAFYFAQLQYEYAKEKSLKVWESDAASIQGLSFIVRNNYSKALYYLNHSLEIEKELGNKKRIASTLGNIGLIYYNKDEFQKAMSYYKRSLTLQKEAKNKKGIANNLSNMGIIYDKQGIYTKAINCYTQSLKVNEELGDKRGIAGALNNIGSIYESQKDYLEAIKYYNQSLNIQEQIGNKIGMAHSIASIGVIYWHKGDYGKAIDYYERSLNIYKQLDNKEGVAMSLNNIGLVYKTKGNYSKAINYYEQSLKFRKEINDMQGLSQSYNNIGNLYLTQKAYTKAIDYSLKAITIAEETGLVIERRDAAKVLHQAYKEKHLYQKALTAYELYIQMRDSIESEENQKEVIRQQYKYEYEKQAAADSVKAAEAAKVKDAQLKAQRAENARQQQQAYYLYGGLALALLFGGFIFNRFRVTNKQKKVIEVQKVEVEKQREFADSQRKLAEEQKEVVEEKNREIIDSINYAKRLQEAILPPAKLVKEYLQQSFILYKPKDIVAGDFYWMESLPNPSKGGANKAADSPPLGELEGAVVYFAAADCTGHGVPGAMVSVVCSNALSKALIEENITNVGKLLDRTRELVVERFGRSEENIQDGMDLALCALNTKTNELHYAGANNPLWVIRKGATEVEETKASKQPIGKYDKEDPFTAHQLQLNKGDSLYIFSDGYPDQFGGDKGKKYKTGAMKRYLLSIQDKDMATQHKLLNQEFENWKGELEQIDDVCVIGVRI